MADRWAEIREIEGQIVAKIVEHDRLLLFPWRWPRCAQLRREIRDLEPVLAAAFESAETRPPAYEGGMNPYMRRRYPA